KLLLFGISQFLCQAGQEIVPRQIRQSKRLLLSPPENIQLPIRVLVHREGLELRRTLIFFLDHVDLISIPTLVAHFLHLRQIRRMPNVFRKGLTLSAPTSYVMLSSRFPHSSRRWNTVPIMPLLR